MEFFFIVAAVIILIEAIEFYSGDRNATGQPKKKWYYKASTSGLKLYIDHETGVHYIKGGFFDKMQVRINADGTPYIAKQTTEDIT